MSIWTLTVTDHRGTRTIIGAVDTPADGRAAAAVAIDQLSRTASPHHQRYHAAIDGHLAAIIGTAPDHTGRPDHRALTELLSHLRGPSPCPPQI